MPLEGEQLIVEPSYPFAKVFEKKPDPKDSDGWVLRNCWYSRAKKCEILIMEKDGKIDLGIVPGFHHITHDLHTMGCSDAWGIEQEANAIETLSELVSARQFKQYLLTGMFLETSKRSRVPYIFRKLKPTVALRPFDADLSGQVEILCTLCMHPIGYYHGSWAGAMCPTDDVLAHLMLMRSDERLFWARSSQHPPYRPESGL